MADALDASDNEEATFFTSSRIKRRRGASSSLQTAEATSFTTFSGDFSSNSREAALSPESAADEEGGKTSEYEEEAAASLINRAAKGRRRLLTKTNATLLSSADTSNESAMFGVRTADESPCHTHTRHESPSSAHTPYISDSQQTENRRETTNEALNAGKAYKSEGVKSASSRGAAKKASSLESSFAKLKASRKRKKEMKIARADFDEEEESSREDKKEFAAFEDDEDGDTHTSRSMKRRFKHRRSPVQEHFNEHEEDTTGCYDEADCMNFFIEKCCVFPTPDCSEFASNVQLAGYLDNLTKGGKIPLKDVFQQNIKSKKLSTLDEGNDAFSTGILQVLDPNTHKLVVPRLVQAANRQAKAVKGYVDWLVENQRFQPTKEERIAAQYENEMASLCELHKLWCSLLICEQMGFIQRTRIFTYQIAANANTSRLDEDAASLFNQDEESSSLRYPEFSSLFENSVETPSLTSMPDGFANDDESYSTSQDAACAGGYCYQRSTAWDSLNSLKRADKPSKNVVVSRKQKMQENVAKMREYHENTHTKFLRDQFLDIQFAARFYGVGPTFSNPNVTLETHHKESKLVYIHFNTVSHKEAVVLYQQQRPGPAQKLAPGPRRYTAERCGLITIEKDKNGAAFKLELNATPWAKGEFAAYWSDLAGAIGYKPWNPREHHNLSEKGGRNSSEKLGIVDIMTAGFGLKNENLKASLRGEKPDSSKAIEKNQLRVQAFAVDSSTSSNLPDEHTHRKQQNEPEKAPSELSKSSFSPQGYALNGGEGECSVKVEESPPLVLPPNAQPSKEKETLQKPSGNNLPSSIEQKDLLSSFAKSSSGDASSHSSSNTQTAASDEDSSCPHSHTNSRTNTETHLSDKDYHFSSVGAILGKQVASKIHSSVPTLADGNYTQQSNTHLSNCSSYTGESSNLHQKASLGVRTLESAYSTQPKAEEICTHTFSSTELTFSPSLGSPLCTPPLPSADVNHTPLLSSLTENSSEDDLCAASSSLIYSKRGDAPPAGVCAEVSGCGITLSSFSASAYATSTKQSCVFHSNQLTVPMDNLSCVWEASVPSQSPEKAANSEVGPDDNVEEAAAVRGGLDLKKADLSENSTTVVSRVTTASDEQCESSSLQEKNTVFDDVHTSHLSATSMARETPSGEKFFPTTHASPNSHTPPQSVKPPSHASPRSGIHHTPPAHTLQENPVQPAEMLETSSNLQDSTPLTTKKQAESSTDNEAPDTTTHQQTPHIPTHTGAPSASLKAVVRPQPTLRQLTLSELFKSCVVKRKKGGMLTKKNEGEKLLSADSHTLNSAFDSFEAEFEEEEEAFRRFNARRREKKSRKIHTKEGKSLHSEGDGDEGIFLGGIVEGDKADEDSSVSSTEDEKAEPQAQEEEKPKAKEGKEKLPWWSAVEQRKWRNLERKRKMRQTLQELGMLDREAEESEDEEFIELKRRLLSDDEEDVSEDGLESDVEGLIASDGEEIFNELDQQGAIRKLREDLEQQEEDFYKKNFTRKAMNANLEGLTQKELQALLESEENELEVHRKRKRGDYDWNIEDFLSTEEADSDEESDSDEDSDVNVSEGYEEGDEAFGDAFDGQSPRFRSKKRAKRSNKGRRRSARNNLSISAHTHTVDEGKGPTSSASSQKISSSQLSTKAKASQYQTGNPPEWGMPKVRMFHPVGLNESTVGSSCFDESGKDCYLQAKLQKDRESRNLSKRKGGVMGYGGVSTGSVSSDKDRLFTANGAFSFFSSKGGRAGVSRGGSTHTGFGLLGISGDGNGGSERRGEGGEGGVGGGGSEAGDAWGGVFMTRRSSFSFGSSGGLSDKNLGYAERGGGG